MPLYPRHLAWLLVCCRIDAYKAHLRRPDNPLPLHLQDGPNPPAEVTLKAAVLHSDPFAIVTEDEDGKLSAQGLQIDLLDRLVHLASEDGIKLTFELDPWQRSAEFSYSAAFDLVADDCEDQIQKLPSNSSITRKYNCSSFDIIVADFFSTAERYQRVDMTPPWLSNEIAVLKYVGNETEEDVETIKKEDEITTLAEAHDAHATICVRKDTPSGRVVMEKFRKALFLQCPHDEDCFDHLRYGRCVLFARDELFLLHKGNEDPLFEVTRERFNTQYMVWPMRYDLPATTTYLLKRWIKRAIDLTIMDELYHEYFAKKRCPLGTAGENCGLPCDPEHGYSDPRSGKCICESTKWTGDDCTIEVKEDLNLIPSSFKWICYSLFLINALAILFCAAWLKRFRHTDQVRASQPFFLKLVLLGCFISSSTIIALAQEKEGDGPFAPCVAAPWLYSIGFCFTFGTLFAKIRRVYLVFQKAARTRKDAVKAIHASPKEAAAISFQETLLTIGAVTLIDVAILTTWTVADPLQWVREVVLADIYGEPLSSQGYCTSDHIGIYAGLIGVSHLILLASGCYLCYKARQIPTMFQEGKYVSLAMVSNLQIFVVGVPILMLDSDPRTSFFVRSVIIWMNNLVVITLIFGNLFYKTLRQTDSSFGDSDVKDKITKAVTHYATGRGDNSSGSPHHGSVACFDDPNKDDQEADKDLEMAVPDVPKVNTTTGGNRRSMVSSISMDSECKCPPTPPPVKMPRSMISSISMDSQSDFIESMGILSSGGLPTLQEQSMASSITTGSLRSARKKNSNRSVTFGMAYSECEDGNEVAFPLDLPRDDTQEPSITKEKRSLARFNSDSAKAAPPRVPKRAPFGSMQTLEQEDALGEDNAVMAADKSTTNNLSSIQKGPPKRPMRRCSTESSCSNESTAKHELEASCDKPSDKVIDSRFPPMKPLRRESSVETTGKLSSVGESPQSACTTEESESTPQTPPTRNGPPKRPLRVVSTVDTLDGESIHEDPKSNAAANYDPPHQPSRFPSRSTLGDDSYHPRNEHVRPSPLPVSKAA